MVASGDARRRLVGALGRRDDALPPSADQWPSVLRLAGDHLLWPALWAAGHARGWWPRLPDEVVEQIDARHAGATPPAVRLQRAHDLNALRNADLLAQLDDVTVALHHHGIDVVALKGAHLLRARWWPDPATRVLRDLDLLVARHDAERAADVLAALGYRPIDAADDPDADHQLPALRLRGRPGSVELHVALAKGRWRHIISADGVLAAGTLDATTAITHVIVGAQLHDEAHLLAQLPLRALVDLSVLIAGDMPPVDWDRVERTFATAGARRALTAFVAMARRQLGVEVPVRLGARSTVRAAFVDVVADHPRLVGVWEPVAYLPRSLASERLDRLYGSGPLWRRRLRHLADAGRRRRASTRARGGPVAPRGRSRFVSAGGGEGRAELSS